MHLEKKTQTTMGQENKSNVLHLIKASGPLSRADVAKTLNMSRSTISSIVDQLIQEGRIREGDIGESTPAGGRKPVELHYISDAKYALGVDIGATKTIAVITDLDGNVIHRHKFLSGGSERSPMEHIHQELQRFIDITGMNQDEMIGTGIGFPGVTLTEQGVVADAPGLHLHNFEAVQFFRDLPGTLIIDNDVNLAVIGERWKGAAQGQDNVVLIAVGTGIGAGFILGGQVYRGANGYAGEMGHVHINPQSPGPRLSLGDYGPLEQVASGSGMEARVRALLPTYPKSLLQQVPVQTDRIFAAAAAGDPLASEVVADSMKYLSFSIANLVSLLNPSMVIIGGGVSRVGDPLLVHIQNNVAQLSPIPCKIVLAGLGEDASAIGGAATVLLQADELRLLQKARLNS